MAPIYRHTKFQGAQKKAMVILEENGPLSYQEFFHQMRQKEIDDIQPVIRGLIDNNLISTYVDESGERVFSVADKIDGE